MGEFVVYCATNKLNNKKYIGKTNNYSLRKQRHEESVTKNRKGFVFHDALRKYGLEFFSWEILFEGDDEKFILEMEKYMINYHNTFIHTGHGYNMTLGGEGTTGIVFSETHLKRLSQSHKGVIPWNKGVPRTQEDKNKISHGTKEGMRIMYENMTNDEIVQMNKRKGNSGETNPFYGKKHTLESRQKIKEARAKQTFSVETREKISQFHKGKPKSPEHIQKLKEAAQRREQRKREAKCLS